MKCECTDPGCKAHKSGSKCDKRARLNLRRIDMEDRTGTCFCEACADDAFASGLFERSISAFIVATKKH